MQRCISEASGLTTPLNNVGHAPPVDQRDLHRLENASREFLDVFQRDRRIVEQRDRDREERRRREEAPAPDVKDRRRAAEDNAQPPSAAVQNDVARRLAARNAPQQPGARQDLARQDPARQDPARQDPAREQPSQPSPSQPPPLLARAPTMPLPGLAGFLPQRPPLPGAGAVANPPPGAATAQPSATPLLFAPDPRAAMAEPPTAALLGPAASSMRARVTRGTAPRPSVQGTVPIAPTTPEPAASAAPIAAPAAPLATAPIAGLVPRAEGPLTLNTATPPEVSVRVNAFLSGAPLDRTPFHIQPMDPLVEAKSRGQRGEAPAPGLSPGPAGPRAGTVRGAPISPLARLLARPLGETSGLTPANDALVPTAPPPANDAPTRPGPLSANDAAEPLGALFFREASAEHAGVPPVTPRPAGPGRVSGV